MIFCLSGIPRVTRTSTSMRGKSASVFPTPGTDRLLSTSTKSKRRFDVKGLKTSPELEGVDNATVLNSGDDCFVNMLFASDTHSRSFAQKKHERKGLVEEANKLGAHQAQGIASRDLHHLCVCATKHSCVLI
jgi:hypothetical protein